MMVELFNPIGYASVALWVCVPLLWLVHALWRPKRWVCHLAVPVAVAGLVLAKTQSVTHISRFEVDRGAQIQEQLSRQAMARRAAKDQRAEEVADIRFAEDNSGEFFDKGGLDDDGLEYFDKITSQDTPAWKQQTQDRSDNTGPAAGDLASQIGAKQERDGVEVSRAFDEPQSREPILVSEREKLLADRLDEANLNTGWVVLALALLFIGLDYVRRLNRYDEAYCPLPVPSAWADALTARPAVLTRPQKPRRPLIEELHLIARRGEVFVYCTDDAASARDAMARPIARLPMGWWPMRVLSACEDERFDDDFVFETLWFGRSSFVIQSPERALAMLECFIARLAERRGSRAHTRQTLHVVWDLAEPIPEAMLKRFAALARATGCMLLIVPKSKSKPQAQAPKLTTIEPTEPIEAHV